MGYVMFLNILVRLFSKGVWDSVVISVIDCHSRGQGFKSLPGQKFGSRFLPHVCPLANSARMSTLNAYCRWEDETARERTGHPPSYAEAKKMKSLTLHTQGCLLG